MGDTIASFQYAVAYVAYAHVGLTYAINQLPASTDQFSSSAAF